MTGDDSIGQYVTDTHALIWHFTRDARLSDEASRHFAAADKGNAIIHVSAMTVIEIVYLGEKARVSQPLCDEVIHLLKPLKDASYRIAPIDHAVSTAIARVPRSAVPEMPDRVIAATAYHLNLPLITKDGRLQDWKGVTTIW
jgi:PIN domain nuclease of toxin-antitoxin system